MSNRSIRWLLAELPGLVSDGVLDEESADRLRKRYPEPSSLSGSRLAVIVCAVFGALLIGSGVILLLAHNWEHLGRPARRPDDQPHRGNRLSGRGGPEYGGVLPAVEGHAGHGVGVD